MVSVHSLVDSKYSELNEQICEEASSMVMFFSSVTILLDNEWPLPMTIALGTDIS